MSRLRIPRAIRRACAFVLTAVAAPAFAQSALQNGTPVQFNLPGQNYVSNYYIDVDAGAKQLRIAASGTNGASADVDLFVRYGTPFPLAGSAAFPTSPQLVSEDTLARWSQYHSISSESSETINVLPGGRVPLTAGRWYVAVINANSGASTVTLTATTFAAPQSAPINIDFSSAGTASDPCDITPWNDTTPATPVGGNNGTTLGAQRRNALTYAVQQLSQELQPPVPITLHACWDHLGGTDQSAVIAQATPVTFVFDTPDQPFPGYSLPLRYTWYAITEAVRESGSMQCGLIGGSCGGTANEEIKATFNSDLGKPEIIGGRALYFGFTPAPNSTPIDFVSVAMHELTHGLGFLGLANTDSTLGPVGAKAGISFSGNSATIGYGDVDIGPYDDVFDINAAIVNGTSWTPFMGYEVIGAGDAARAAALKSGNGLRWSESTAVDSTDNTLRALPAPQNFVQLYAPNPISNGSTLSHIVQGGQLMNPNYGFPPPRTLGLAKSMLAPLGWAASATAPVYAQPIPSNWFDASHGGHGFDFQLVGRDPVYGDSYILVFYSYDANGVPEWYFAQGNLVDGVFVAGLDANGNTLLYSTYGADHSPGHLALTQQNIVGNVVVDFNQADKAPECRDVDRSANPVLGLMSWTIGNDSGDWCMQPLIGAAQHATPDYNGHWYAPSDGGWGMEILNYDGNASSSTLFVLIYYPDATGKPAWALATGTLSNGSANLQVLARTNGYCRTCAPPATTATTPIGNIALQLTPPAGATRATGSATLTINYPGGGSFSRSNDPITTLSLAPGQ
jgi:hypothetical protein